MSSKYFPPKHFVPDETIRAICEVQVHFDYIPHYSKTSDSSSTAKLQTRDKFVRDSVVRESCNHS